MENEKLERREMLARDLAVRSADGGPAVVTGYAVVFNTWSQVLHDWFGGAFRERFAPEAFDRWLAGDPELVALWNHNADMPLARLSRGTLRIAKDGTGLRFEFDAPPNAWGEAAVVAIQRGDVTGMSFLFEHSADTWGKPDAEGVAERTVLESILHEISPVTFPAYPSTTVKVRSVRVPDFSETDGRAAAEDQLSDRPWAALLEVRRRRLNLYRRVRG